MLLSGRSSDGEGVKLFSWFSEQEDPGSIPGLAATISDIGYLLFPGSDMAERSLKRRKSSKQPQNNDTSCKPDVTFCIVWRARVAQWLKCSRD